MSLKQTGKEARMPKYTDKFEEIDKSKIGEMAKSKKDTSARFINLMRRHWERISSS